jgi:prolyl-tRNA synthetase
MEKAAIKPRHTRQAVVKEMCVDTLVRTVVAAALVNARDDTQGVRRTPVTPMNKAILARLKIQDHDVKCASRKGISPVNVGTSLMIHLFLMNAMQEQPSLYMLQIQVSILTLALLIM